MRISELPTDELKTAAQMLADAPPDGMLPPIGSSFIALEPKTIGHDRYRVFEYRPRLTERYSVLAFYRRTSLAPLTSELHPDGKPAKMVLVDGVTADVELIEF